VIALLKTSNQRLYILGFYSFNLFSVFRVLMIYSSWDVSY